MDKKLIEECVSIYKNGGSRMDVARKIMKETGFKKTASKDRAKVIWERYFDEEYVTPSSKERSEEYKNEDGGMKTGSVKFDEQDEDHATAESKSDNVRTLEDLLKVCDVDLDYWEVERHIINKWEVAAKTESYDNTGRKIQKMNHSPLFQVKAWLKKREVKNAEEVVDYFQQALSKIIPKPKPRSHNGKKMYEISIPDLHLAKMAWAKETGQPWDIKIAPQCFRDAFYHLVDQVDLNEIDTLLVPIGNDFFNSEGLSGETTAGTRQDDDSRWQKSYSVGCNLITSIVDDISDRVNVKIVIVQGNHDHERDYYFGEFLKAWYRFNEAVEIDNSPTTRKYVEFGQNLILFTHGNEEKQTELPLLMATEHSSFSKCKYRTAHLGHFHQYQVKENKGVTVKILPSLCATDAWHSKKGYTGNRRAAMGFLYDYGHGEIANFYYNLEE
jgi:predicted phosphodiesterase